MFVTVYLIQYQNLFVILVKIIVFINSHYAPIFLTHKDSREGIFSLNRSLPVLQETCCCLVSMHALSLRNMQARIVSMHALSLRHMQARIVASLECLPRLYACFVTPSYANTYRLYACFVTPSYASTYRSFTGMLASNSACSGGRQYCIRDRNFRSIGRNFWSIGRGLGGCKEKTSWVMASVHSAYDIIGFHSFWTTLITSI